MSGGKIYAWQQQACGIIWHQQAWAEASVVQQKAADLPARKVPLFTRRIRRGALELMDSMDDVDSPYFQRMQWGRGPPPGDTRAMEGKGNVFRAPVDSG